MLVVGFLTEFGRTFSTGSARPFPTGSLKKLENADVIKKSKMAPSKNFFKKFLKNFF